MLVVRGTKELRERVKGAPVADGDESTTALGDWFANALFWKPQVALLVNSKTLLPVFMRNALREYFPAALEAFADLADRDALAVLAKAPTPDAAARLTVGQIVAALKRGGRATLRPAFGNPTGAAHRPTRGARGGDERVRRHDQSRRRDHRRDEPPDRRTRSRAHRGF